MPFRLLAILALLAQPFIVGAGCLRASVTDVRLVRCVCTGQVVEAGEPVGCAAERDREEPCCTDLTPGDPASDEAACCESDCVCEPGLACIQPFLPASRITPIWTGLGKLSFIRGGHERGPVDELEWMTLPAHTRASLALPAWEVTADRPSSRAEPRSEDSGTRLARLCVWTI